VILEAENWFFNLQETTEGILRPRPIHKQQGRQDVWVDLEAFYKAYEYESTTEL